MNTAYWINTIMSAAYTNSSGSFYVGLSYSQPTSNGGNVSEPQSGGYSRVRITGFTQPQDGTVRNSSAIIFPKSAGVWFPENRKAAYWVLFDGAGSAAHVLAWGELDEPRVIQGSTVVSIASGALTITLANTTAS